jgi:hypothetical protein
MYTKVSWFSFDIQQHNPVAFISRSKAYLSTAGKGPCHTHFRVWDSSQLQARDRATLILGYAFYSLLKTELWLWNAEQQ